MSWSIRLRIALGAASALKYLHRHRDTPVFHRDVKSANIVLMNDFTPKLIDCGLAKYISPSSDEEGEVGMSLGRSQGVRVGTSEYMCNYYRNTGNFTAKSEVYSMGIILLELIHGRTQGSLYYGEKIIFGENGNNLPIDIRAGRCPCADQLIQLAVSLIAPYDTRVDSMGEVIRPLREMEQSFSKITLDDLQQQNNQYLAEINKLKQQNALQEEILKDVQSCTVCYVYFNIVQLIACNSAGRHFICRSCLAVEMTRQPSAREVFRQQGSRIVCLQCYTPYTKEQLATASST